MNFTLYIKTIFLLVIFTGVFTIRAKATSFVYKNQQNEQIIKAQKPFESENSSNQLPAEENKEEKDNEKEADDENESESGGKHRQNNTELLVSCNLLIENLNSFSFNEKVILSYRNHNLKGKDLTPIYISIHSFRI